MLLETLKLHNIRSYTDETINFRPGNSVLAGDIGSGKSSILLAIEFALFGTSRTNLPGDFLLRKGKTSGYVELHFSLPNKQIVIKRNLKKDKNSVKQQAGHITINGVQKDLMPIEMKSEMISLLGYPLELLTKTKNFIFRYTIYTPQEEMKQILTEIPEVRMDVLRKIFNVDKYKQIRENVQTYLKKMRSSLTILKTRCEPYQQYLDEKNHTTKNIEHHIKTIDEFLPLLHQAREHIGQITQELSILEEKQQEFNKIKNEHTTLKAILEQKEITLQKKIKEQQELQTTISQLPKIQEDDLEKELADVSRRHVYIQKKDAEINQEIKSAQSIIVETKQQITAIAKNQEHKPELLQLISTLQEKIQTKEDLTNKQHQLAQLALTTEQGITKNATLLSHSHDLVTKISSLDLCPTCLQNVTSEHKDGITQKEHTKVQQAQNLLDGYEKKLQEIKNQQKETSTLLEEVGMAQQKIITYSNQLEKINVQQQELDIFNEKLQIHINLNNELMEKSTELNATKVITNLQLQQKQLQDKVKHVATNKRMNQELASITIAIDTLHQEIQADRIHFSKLKLHLENVKDNTPRITELRKDLTQTHEQEKELSLTETKMKTTLQHLQETLVKTNLLLEKVESYKQTLHRQQELKFWLESHFLKITHSIEKHVMHHIYRLFNELFQEWFSMLIDCEHMYARLDEQFTPIIEQNGYEVSFANLSGGEKTSAALAYRLALNKVINDVIHTINTKDLLILDEPTDGFSHEQLDKVREVIERLSLKQIIIVSHEPKIESFVENVIRIRKLDHVSQVC